MAIRNACPRDHFRELGLLVQAQAVAGVVRQLAIQFNRMIIPFKTLLLLLLLK
jgi:hypothetical protein